MLLAAILGALSGLLATFAFWSMQFVLASTDFHEWLQNHWYFVPLGMAVIASAFPRERSKRAAEFNEGLADLIEEYHFGIQRSGSVTWFLRAIVSGIGAFFTGIFGPEGLVIEGATAIIQAAMSRFPKSFQRVIRHDFEFRQILAGATMAGAISVVLGTPFAGAFLALEILMVSSARMRIAAMTSSLAAFASWKLMSNAFGVEHFGILPAMIGGYRPLSLDFSQQVLLSMVAVLVGALVAGLSVGMGRGIGWLQNIGTKLKWSHGKLTLASGAIIASTIAVTPDAFVEPWRIWQEMTWQHLTASTAVIIFLARAIALSFALPGMGSTGMITPFLFLACLVGYVTGNAFQASWALPLAFAAMSAVLMSAFSAPLAAITLVFEISRDGHLWWLSLVATGAAYLFTRLSGESLLMTNLLAKRGMRLHKGRCTNVLIDIQMKDAMVKDVVIISDNATLAELQKAAADSSYNVLGVSNGAGEFRGLLSLDQLPNNADLRGISTRDLLDLEAIEVKPNDPLEDAFELLTSVPALAVVDNQRRLVGLVFKAHLIARYQREVGRRALIHYTAGRLGR